MSSDNRVWDAVDWTQRRPWLKSDFNYVGGKIFPLSLDEKPVRRLLANYIQCKRCNTPVQKFSWFQNINGQPTFILHASCHNVERFFLFQKEQLENRRTEIVEVFEEKIAKSTKNVRAISLTGD
jgi:hypothetical protein